MAYNNAPDYQATQYYTITGGDNNQLNFVSPGTAGQLFTSNGASSQPSYQITTVATNVGTSASPTGTSSSTYVNMGLGSGWTLTPKSYGNVMISIDGSIIISTTPSVVAQLLLCYGTGTAPSNGAADTGTTVGINTLAQNSTVTLPYGVPFTKSYLITG